MRIDICGDSDIPDLAKIFVEMDSYYFGSEAASYEEMLSYLTHRFFSVYSGVSVVGAWKTESLSNLQRSH